MRGSVLLRRCRVRVPPRLAARSRLLAWCLLVFLSTASLGGSAAAEVFGKPPIHNYSHRDFRAEVQTWAVVQDRRGLMYFANNAGVLEYDGSTWRLIELPSRREVRSLAVETGGSGRILVGGRGDFGYLDADATGQLRFHSLLPPDAGKDRRFDLIYSVTAVAGGAFFYSREKSCRWFDARLQCRDLDARESRIFPVADALYVQQRGRGLMRLVGETMELVPGGERFARDEVALVLGIPGASGDPGATAAAGGTHLVVGTRTFDLFRYDGTSFEPFALGVGNGTDDELHDGVVLTDGSIALATLRRGVLILDRQGRIKQHIDQAAGLQNDHVHALWLDQRQGLWLALQNGISRVEVASPFSVFGDEGLEHEWREVIRHRGVMYGRGGRGLFAASIEDSRASPSGAAASRVLRFTRISGIAPPVWAFASIEDRLLVSGRDGIYEMEGTHARRVAAYDSTPLIMFRSRHDPARVYIGLVGGIAALRLVDGVWRDEGRLDAIDESITSIAEGAHGDLWLVGQMQRILRVDLTGTPAPRSQGWRPVAADPRVAAYVPQTGDPSLTGRLSVRTLAGRVVLLTEEGIFRFDDSADRFVQAPEFAVLTLAGRRSFSWISDDADGNIWVISRKPGHVDVLEKQADGSYVVRDPRLHQVQVWSIYHEPAARVVWFCAAEHLLRYDLGMQPRAAGPFSTLIRRVVVNEQTVAYGGAPPSYAIGRGASPSTAIGPEAPPSDAIRSDARRDAAPGDPRHVFSARTDAVQFEFAAPRYEGMERMQFQSYLEGFDETWSEWTTRRDRSYTNLPERAYRFHVRARNAQGAIGPAAVFAFSILPPWYRSWWAFALYASLTGALLVLFRRVELRRARVTHQQELERAELEKLRELDRLKSRFFADISHEFRTPLTLILGPVEQMLRSVSAPELRLSLDAVRRNAQRLLRLIVELLDLAKLEAGRVRLQATPTDLIPYVQAIAESFTAAAWRQGIELKCDWPAETDDRRGLRVYADRDVLEKILNNLLWNAFKFTPAGGVVSVAIRRVEPDAPPRGADDAGDDDDDANDDKGFVEIVVADTGTGIPVQYLPRIFDRFYQAEGTRRLEGVGIGLALVKELVELHYGRIVVESEEGVGATFVVRLPRGKTHLRGNEIAAEAAAPVAEALQGRREAIEHDAAKDGGTGDAADEHEDTTTTILIVEDHDDMRSFLRRHLQPHYKVVDARNGLEGFEKAVVLLPDLILCDVMMPEMNGYELCKAMKGDQRVSHIPVILVTARAGHEDKLMGLETGADQYLIKPFDSMELLMQVRSLIRQRRLLRERFSGAVVLKPSEMAITSMDESFLNNVLDVVQKHLEDPDFDVRRLATEVGFSRSQLHRKVRALTNQTPTLLIRSIRLQRGAELLRRKVGSVAEIAYMVGFKNQSHFGQSFREQFGCSPTQYVQREEERRRVAVEPCSSSGASRP